MATPLSQRDDLPQFPCFPYAYEEGDSLKNPAFEASDEACACCGKARGVLTTLDPFGGNPAPRVCPWCVADGSAFENEEQPRNRLDETTLWDETPDPPEPVHEPAYEGINPFTGEKTMYRARTIYPKHPTVAPFEESAEEIEKRTPIYNSWQGLEWWSHCRQAGVYLGIATRAMLEALSEDEIVEFRKNNRCDDDEELWQEILAHCEPCGDDESYEEWTVHLFKCPECGRTGGYAECT